MTDQPDRPRLNSSGLNRSDTFNELNRSDPFSDPLTALNVPDLFSGVGSLG